MPKSLMYIGARSPSHPTVYCIFGVQYNLFVQVHSFSSLLLQAGSKKKGTVRDKPVKVKASKAT